MKIEIKSTPDRLRWIADEKGIHNSISETIYVDIMHADPIKLALYLTDSNHIIRRIAEARVGIWKQNQKMGEK